MGRKTRNLLKLFFVLPLLAVCLTAFSQAQDTLAVKKDTTTNGRYKFTKKDYIPK